MRNDDVYVYIYAQVTKITSGRRKDQSSFHQVPQNYIYLLSSDNALKQLLELCLLFIESTGRSCVTYYVRKSDKVHIGRSSGWMSGTTKHGPLQQFITYQQSDYDCSLTSAKSSLTPT